MLSRKAISRLARRGVVSKNVTASSSVSQFSSAAKKSWVPTQDDILQKVTSQSLIHEISLKQMESAQVVVPWFLTNMPVAYFRQVPETLRKQHLTAIAVCLYSVNH